MSPPPLKPEIDSDPIHEALFLDLNVKNCLDQFAGISF